MWEAVEPLHAVVYFAPEPAEAAKAIGLRGWWMGYFAGRVAPLGPVEASAVTAMLYGFAPGMVARALPDAWSRADPQAVLSTRIEAAGRALRERVDGAEPAVRELAELLVEATDACTFDARPLAAAWAALPPREDPFEKAWLAATVLREHRGDGHVLAGVTAGLSGLDATLTLVATGAVPREAIQPNRGWTDDDWDESVLRLQAAGLLDDGGQLTEAGRALRRTIEDATDRLAAAPVERLGPARAERVIDVAAPISRRLIDDGLVPVPNPIGAPRP